MDVAVGMPAVLDLMSYPPETVIPDDTWATLCEIHYPLFRNQWRTDAANYLRGLVLQQLGNNYIVALDPLTLVVGYWFRCELCNRKYVSEKALVQHYRDSTRHPTCEHCDTSFPDLRAREAVRLLRNHPFYEAHESKSACYRSS